MTEVDAHVCQLLVLVLLLKIGWQVLGKSAVRVQLALRAGSSQAAEVRGG